jgi:hypothetical protein
MWRWCRQGDTNACSYGARDRGIRQEDGQRSTDRAVQHAPRVTNPHFVSPVKLLIHVPSGNGWHMCFLANRISMHDRPLISPMMMGGPCGRPITVNYPSYPRKRSDLSRGEVSAVYTAERPDQVRRMILLGLPSGRASGDGRGHSRGDAAALGVSSQFRLWFWGTAWLGAECRWLRRQWKRLLPDQTFEIFLLELTAGTAGRRAADSQRVKVWPLRRSLKISGSPASRGCGAKRPGTASAVRS